MNTITFTRTDGTKANAQVEGTVMHGTEMTATLEDGSTTKVRWDGVDMRWEEISA